MTPEILVGLIGAGISILFKIVKPLDVWLYTKVPDQWRGLVSIGVVVLVTGAIFGLGCAGIIGGIGCTVDGAKELFTMLGVAVVSNQITFLSTPSSTTKLALAK